MTVEGRNTDFLLAGTGSERPGTAVATLWEATLTSLFNAPEDEMTSRKPSQSAPNNPRRQHDRGDHQHAQQQQNQQKMPRHQGGQRQP